MYVYRDWYLAQKKISMTDFLKDHFILITRIFDKRVKDFHTEVMNKKGIVIGNEILNRRGLNGTAGSNPRKATCRLLHKVFYTFSQKCLFLCSILIFQFYIA